MEIQLSNGGITVIDSSDFEIISGYKWHRHDETHAQYVRAAKCKAKKQTIFLMHRIITQAPPGIFVDHIDGNGLNNRRSNLRLCNCQQNCMNQKMFKNNTSGFKGVSWSKTMNKWEAYIWFKRKKTILGYFADKFEAASVRAEAENKLFGDWPRYKTIDMLLEKEGICPR